MSVYKDGDFTGLILVSGIDKPGMTLAVLDKLAEFSIEILDIKQIITGNRLLQTILIKCLPDHALAVESDLLELADKSSFDVAIDFSPYTHNQEMPECAFITFVAKSLDLKNIARIARYIHQIDANILDITFAKLNDLKGISFKFNIQGLKFDEIQNQVKQIALEAQIDLCLTTESFRKAKKLFVFDMDSTLISQEVIDQLASKANKALEVSAITERAMNGELDFEESLRQRVAMLAGVSEELLKETSSTLTFNPGVIQTLQLIRQAGNKVAVVSGGFSDVIEKPLMQIPVDYLFANKLEISNSTLTGKLSGEIIDGLGKANSLRTISMSEDVPLLNTVVVGDGANDLKMMAIAGYSFAYNAKEIVKQGAMSTISHPDMRALILLLNL